MSGEDLPKIPFNSIGKLYFDKLVVSNIEGHENIELDFSCDRRKSVYIVQCLDLDPSLRSLVTMAVRLICSSQYAKADPGDLGPLQQATIKASFYYPHSSTQLPHSKRCINMADDPDIIALNPKPAQYEPMQSELLMLETSDSGDDDLPCTSKQAIYREMRRRDNRLNNRQIRKDIEAAFRNNMPHHDRISVRRSMNDNPGNIRYRVNDGAEKKCSVVTFQQRFQLNVSDVFPCAQEMGDDGATKKGDWLHFISTRLNDCWNQKAQLDHLFEQFVHIYTKDKGCSNQQLLTNLTTQCLRGQLALDVLQKEELLQIFKETRRVFEFISNSEYTVYFVMPLHNVQEHIEQVAMDDINFNKIDTYIQKKGDPSNPRFLWNTVKHTIQDLLIIAFQLVLAFRCQQKVIYLQNMDSICEHQTLDIATIALMKTKGINNEYCSKVNYLQRIIHVCVQFDVCAFIEYPGGVPVQHSYSYLLQWTKTKKQTWVVRINNAPNHYLSEDFLKEFFDSIAHNSDDSDDSDM